jgi:hypothetical protein
MEKALADYPNDGTPYSLIEPDRTDHNIYIAFEDARVKVVGGMARADYPAPRYFVQDVPTQDPLRATQLKERRLSKSKVSATTTRLTVDQRANLLGKTLKPSLQDTRRQLRVNDPAFVEGLLPIDSSAVIVH